MVRDEKLEETLTAACGTPGDVATALSTIYDELRRVAARHFAGGGANTLQPTAMVHEAFLRLSKQESLTWRSETHFFALAAREVRRVMVDHWRGKVSARREGSALQMPLELASSMSDEDAGLDPEDLLSLDEALVSLGMEHERPARVAELAFFAGLSQVEISTLLGLSRKTIASDWAFARAWLTRELS